MIKRTLISFILILIVMITIMIGFSHYVDIKDHFFIADEATINSELQTVDYIFDFKGKATDSKPSEYCIIMGKYNEKDCYYYTVFSKEGKKIAEGGFGGSLSSCIIHDIRTSKDGIYVLCEENNYASLYFIDMSNDKSINMSEKLNFNMLVGEEKAIKLLLPDENCDYIVAAGNTSANLYGVDGALVKQYQYTEKSIISCGIYKDDVLILCGAESEFSDIFYFNIAFVEIFNENCESVLYKNLYTKSGCISSAMECQFTEENHLKIFGRYFDYSNANVKMSSLEVNQYNEFGLFGHGADYYIYDNTPMNGANIVQSSVFISEIDLQGNEINVQLYSSVNDYRVPSLAQQMSIDKMDKDSSFVLTLARVSPEKDSYFLSANEEVAEIPLNIILYYDLDSSGGVYACVKDIDSEMYNIKYFKSFSEIEANMRELEKAMYFAELFDTAFPIMMVSGACLMGFVLLIAKHKWRGK